MNIAKMMLWGLLICGLSANAIAQTAPVEPLKIGDRVPDLVFNNVINARKGPVKFSEFKDKLLILDFWATWCHWCIAEFPKDDALQKKYHKHLQILLVNSKKMRDDEKKVRDFYQKRLIKYKDFKLPSLYMDTVLQELFPHYVIPHYVWIKNGVVKAFTDQDEVTEAHIKALLEGKEVAFKMKIDAEVKGPFPGKD